MVDYFRKKTRRPIALEMDENVPSNETNPEQMAELTLSIEQLTKATQSLTKLQREVISMRFAGGLSIEEVARSLGKNPGAIKALQHAAVIALRKVLVKEHVAVKIDA
jgi:RNA polymerase sigma-70 factor (ECF subfamily)